MVKHEGRMEAGGLGEAEWKLLKVDESFTDVSQDNESKAMEG